MVEIKIEEVKSKYQAELDSFVRQLQQLDQQRAILAQAIAERQGIIAFLNSLNTDGEKNKKVKQDV